MEQTTILNTKPRIVQEESKFFLVVNGFRTQLHTVRDLILCSGGSVDIDLVPINTCEHRNHYGMRCIKPSGHARKHQYVRKNYSKKNKKAKLKFGSQSEFIRKHPKLSGKELVKLAKEHGMDIRPDTIYGVRWRDNRGGKK